MNKYWFTGVLILFIISGYFVYYSPFLSGIFSGVLPILKTSPSLPSTGELPFSLPSHFSISVFADNVPGVRVITRDPNGTIAASLTDEGKVVLLPDTNGDHKTDQVITILQDLNRPHGLYFHCTDDGLEPEARDCFLYVAETNALHVYPYNPATRKVGAAETLMMLPAGGRHTTRTLLPHPDNKRLLISIGSTCDVCEETDARAAAIYSVDLESKKTSLYATGLRNSVFLAIHPVTGNVWATEMGRDWLGDNLPPDEINIIEEDGNYGWPFCYGKNKRDTSFTSQQTPSNCDSFTASHLDIPAHSAPLGLTFIPEEGWPEEYWHDLLVAYHGSWNRSTPTGYKITRFNLTSEGKPQGESVDFMTGFLNSNNEIIGRPVALLAEPGGILWISDDRTGKIYRATLTE